MVKPLPLNILFLATITQTTSLSKGIYNNATTENFIDISQIENEVK